MATLTTPTAHRAEIAGLIGAVTAGTRKLWRRLGSGDFDESWGNLGPQVLALWMAGQLAVARESRAYVADVLDEQHIDAPPVARASTAAVVGVASSGVDLSLLLPLPVIATRAAMAQGMKLAMAQDVGGRVLDGITQMQVADAGRAIESVETVVRPAVTGYVRHLNTPSCAKCAILAGRFYRWNDGFQRHPKCDCFHVPVTGNVADDLRTDTLGAIKAGQVTGISKADMKAIVEDGAEPSQVINAQRGMYTGQVFGQSVKATREGVTSRGLAGKRLDDLAKVKGRKLRESQTVRLRPESIYKIAGDDRAEALRLLKRFGYVL